MKKLSSSHSKLPLSYHKATVTSLPVVLGSGVSLQCEGFKLEAESIRDGYQTLTDQLRGVSVDAKVFPVPFSA